MTIFNTPRPSFGQNKGDQYPSPIVGKAAAHRTASLKSADDILAILPGSGETLHALMTGRFDLMHPIVALVGKLGRCDSLCIATLSYNGKNLTEMIGLLDSEAVGSLTLLCSAFFRDHNTELWQETLSEFRERGQRAAAARSHAKIVTLATADGRKLSIEGSANLRTNSNREQFALTDDAAVHDWHTTWITDLVAAREGENVEDAAP